MISDPTPITASVIMTMADTQFPVMWVFNPLNPFEIMLDFNRICQEESCPGHNVEWHIGRALLEEGATSETWVGEGDVKVRRDSHFQMAMIVQNATGSAMLTFARSKAIMFLRRCSNLVPEGTEMDGFDWDEFDAERVTW